LIEPLLSNSAPYKTTASWMLWESKTLSVPLLKKLDHLFSDYTFYPEIEWSKFGCYPPEMFNTQGAWKNKEETVFIFLLSNIDPKPRNSTKNLWLYSEGSLTDLDAIHKKISRVKSEIAKIETRDFKTNNARNSLATEDHTNSATKLLKLAGFFTAIVNALSIYLQHLPAPLLPTQKLTMVYQSLLAVIHILSLSLLIILILLFIGYVVRYGLLVLRKF